MYAEARRRRLGVILLAWVNGGLAKTNQLAVPFGGTNIPPLHSFLSRTTKTAVRSGCDPHIRLSLLGRLQAAAHPSDLSKRWSHAFRLTLYLAMTALPACMGRRGHPRTAVTRRSLSLHSDGKLEEEIGSRRAPGALYAHFTTM